MAGNNYYINTRKIFLIWFSNNPKVFLGEKNKERLIKLRERNPDAEISFV